MIRSCRWSTVLGFAAGAIALASCVSEARDSDPRQLNVLTSETAEERLVIRLIERQRSFIDALAGGDPTPFMSTRFEMVDWTDPATQPSQGLGGHVASGHDFLQTLSDRIPQKLSHLEAIEVHFARPDQAVIISKHQSGVNSITHWNRTDPGWNAFIVILECTGRDRYARTPAVRQATVGVACAVA